MGVGRMARLESVRFKISCYSPFNITYAEDAEDDGCGEDGEAGECQIQNLLLQSI
jgi:hypothetical protein